MKHILVTGIRGGIGRAIAERFLERGAFVFGTHTPANPLDFAHPQSAVCGVDLSTINGAEQLAQFVRARTPKLDVLVLNAGTTARGGLQDITPENWQTVMDTNLTVPLFLIQKLENLIPPGGRIVLIGSMMGVHPHGMSLAYGVSKAGVHALAENLPKFFEGRNITVNAIAPGFVETPWQAEKPAEIRANIEAKVALHRFADPAEIADLCVHITENGYLNGTVVQIHGGYGYR